MLRQFLIVALTGSALVSMASGPALAQPVAPSAPAAAPAAGKPVYGSYGFDTAGMDTSVAPGDNFYQYANGTWAKNTPIPADKSNYGVFTVLDDLSKARTRDILESAKTDPASKIGRAYAAYLDLPAVEKKGLAPLKPWLAEIKAVKTRAAYAVIVAKARRNGVGAPFSGGVGQDDKAPDTYIFNVNQGGLSLPDRDYYLSKTPEMAKIRDQYVAHMTRMFALAGEPNGAARAKAILAFETGIAKAHWTRIESRDADKTYNRMTVARLTKLAPGFDFATYLKTNHIAVKTLLVAQPSAVKGEAALIARTPLAVLKDQLLLRSLHDYAEFLPETIAQADFDFYGTVLSGTPERQERWKRAVDFLKGSLGEEVGKVYVAKYFPPETKAAADRLVRNIIAAMGRRIDGLTWMSGEAKARAHEKLAAFTPKIGYPDKWRDYTGLTIKADDLFGDAWRSNQFDYDYNIGKLGKPIYRWEWGMTPMEINAYANFGMVEIVFPAAILQPPFFDPNADDAVNYGGIGVVIGHELSHHFDDQGAKYDKTGKLVQWWTDQDVKNFKVLTDRLAAQYDQYEPIPGLHVQGKLTLGENIADLAGLTVSWDAYNASLAGKAAPVIDGTTAAQRFYYGYAQVWRRNYREANLRQRLLTDPHSPSEQRVATIRNLDPWYDAFKPQPGQKLYLAPEDRVKIW